MFHYLICSCEVYCEVYVKFKVCIFHYRKILNDLSSDSPVKVEPYEESNTGSSEATGDSPSSEVGEVSGGSASVQVSSTDGIPMQSMQAIQIPTANGQSQQATVVQFNGQVRVCLVSFFHKTLS